MTLEEFEAIVKDFESSVNDFIELKEQMVEDLKEINNQLK